MRKLLVVTLVGALLFSVIPGVALAGGQRTGSDVAAGLVLGATAAVVGGVLLNAFGPPVVYAPAPPVVYAPAPPVVYAPPPPVVYSAPPVVYAPPPVVTHRDWAPRHHGREYDYRHGRGWHRH